VSLVQFVTVEGCFSVDRMWHCPCIERRNVLAVLFKLLRGLHRWKLLWADTASVFCFV